MRDLSIERQIFKGITNTMNPVSLSSGSDLMNAINAQSAAGGAPPTSGAMKAMQVAIDQSAQSISELLGDLASGSSSGNQLNVYA